MRKIARWLYREIERKGTGRLDKVKKDLRVLYPRKVPAQALEEYYLQKIQLVLIVLLSGLVLAIGLGLQKNQKLRQSEGEEAGAAWISRGDYREKNQTIALEVLTESGLTQEVQVEIGGRVPTWEEANLLEQQFWQEVSGLVLGEKEAYGGVTEDLYLPESLDGYPFMVEWQSANRDLIGDEGEITASAEQFTEQQERRAILCAQVSYEQWEWQHQLEVMVTKEAVDSPKRFGAEIELMLEQAETESRQEAEFILPMEWNGHILIWKEKQQSPHLLILGLTVFLGVTIYFLKDRDLHTQRLARDKVLRKEYSAFVNRLLLYLGAGLTVRSAWERIAADYRTNVQPQQEKTVYEEVLYTVRELHNGVSEAEALERFGFRCGVQEYVRLAALLVQNQKRGNSTLLQQLQQECQRVLEEEMNQVRRLSQEASSKLLVPMILMLGMIMVMIMVPAFCAM